MFSSLLSSLHVLPCRMLETSWRAYRRPWRAPSATPACSQEKSPREPKGWFSFCNTVFPFCMSGRQWVCNGGRPLQKIERDLKKWYSFQAEVDRQSSYGIRLIEMETFFMHSSSFREKQWCENDFLTLVYSQHTHTHRRQKSVASSSLCVNLMKTSF